MAFGDQLKVRVLSPFITGTDPECSVYPMIFDASKKNNLREPNQGRYLFQRYFFPTLPGSPPDNSPTEAEIILNSSDNEAVVNFTKDHRQSDLDGFAVGYGLYFFCIDIPSLECDPDHTHIWDRVILPIDFRDSRFTNTYGTGEDIEILFKISPYPLITDPKNCGVYPPFEKREGVEPFIRITSPRVIELTPPDGSRRFNIDQQAVETIFEKGIPEYDFTIENQLVDPSVEVSHLPDIVNYIGMGQILSHPAILKQNNYSMNDGYTQQFVITTRFEVEFGNGVFYYRKESDVAIYVEGQPEFTGGHWWNVVKAIGTSENRRVSFRKNPTSPEGDITGLKFSSSNAIGTYIRVDFDLCDIRLDEPIKYICASLPTTAVSRSPLNVRRSILESTTSLLYPYGLTVVDIQNVLKVNIQGCSLVGGMIGIRASGDCRGSLIGGDIAGPNENIIQNMNGHGIEMIALKSKGYAGTNIVASDVFKVGYNIIEDNKGYGIHIREADTNPYIFGNIIEHNGFTMPDVNMWQSRQADAVNVNQAFGVFQKNYMRNSGAYGLHAAAAAEPKGYDPKAPDLFKGENCISNNYFNIGANHSSKLWLGSPKNVDPNYSGGYNSIINPRGTWSTTAWQVTLDILSYGFLEWNYWKPDQLIQAVNGADYTSTDLQTEAEAVCPNGLTSGGGYSNSSTHQNIVDSINVAIHSSNWVNAKSYSLLLLNIQPDPIEATIASSALVTTYLNTNDATILQSLHDFAIDLSDTSRLLATAAYAMKAHNIAQQYMVSVAIGDSIAKWFPYSEHWQMAYLQNAYVLWDFYRNKSAAEELLLSVWNLYQDSYTIGAYISIMGEYPPGLFAKRASPYSRKTIANFSLEDCYPNPFNPSTTIAYSLPSDGTARLFVRDALGREISVIHQGYQSAGRHTRNFDASGLPSGIYFYTLTFEQSTLTKPMMLVK